MATGRSKCFILFDTNREAAGSVFHTGSSHVLLLFQSTDWSPEVTRMSHRAEITHQSQSSYTSFINNTAAAQPSSPHRSLSPDHSQLISSGDARRARRTHDSNYSSMHDCTSDPGGYKAASLPPAAGVTTRVMSHSTQSVDTLLRPVDGQHSRQRPHHKVVLAVKTGTRWFLLMSE